MGPFEQVILKIFLPLSGIVSVLLFSWKLKRRKYFWVRLAAFVVLYVGIDYLSSLVSISLERSDTINPDLKIFLHCLFNVGTFLVTSALLFAVYNEKIRTIIFCGISAKCTMHIAEYLSKIIFYFTVMNTFLSIAVYAVVYVLIYFLFARRIRGEDCAFLDNIQVILFTFIVLIATDIVILNFNGRGLDSNTNIFVFFLIAIVCLLILFLQFNLFAESRHKLKDAVISQIREKEREQYEISKENINLIGIRQHDLKNMLASRNIGIAESEFNEIIKSIDGYDLPFNTGNRTLDMILMEKYRTCRLMKIRLECLAEGEQMDFIEEMDIYSLFLNALNNAIESANKIEEEQKRVIWLKTHVRGKLLFIQVQNYFNEIVRTAYGFSTTKPDKNNHGFGLKSMRMIAEKYGGDMSVNTENNMFCLGFVIPVP